MTEVVAPGEPASADRGGRRVGLVFDDRFLNHNTGLALVGDVDPYPFADPVPHVSSPALVGRAKHLLDLHGLTDAMVRLEPHLAGDEALLAYHYPDHLQRVADLSRRGGGDTGEGAPIGPGGDRIARLAAGGTMAAVEAVLTGRVAAAYALVRPPGHHAMADRGMGFCVYNNAVVATRYAQRLLGAERVAVIDWDVHHGNGTQAAFWDDRSVLFVSVHQDDLYPVGWGAVDHLGTGDGEGYTVNIPLPGGSGNRAYLEVFERIVAPVVRQFAPDLIVISAGQDASVLDPLARMALTVDGYRELTRTMLAVADGVCDGRVVLTQEGGYSATYAPYCTAAIAETVVGTRPGVTSIPDPYGERSQSMPPSIQVGLDAERAIERAIATLKRCWTL
jgi:acetoin utilization deacetylase AcuC-like enzyme